MPRAVISDSDPDKILFQVVWVIVVWHCWLSYDDFMEVEGNKRLPTCRQ